VSDATSTCPLVHARFEPDYMRVDDQAHYSAAETRGRRASEPGACCYVEFVTGACR
jgi:hypothetical protein